ncbi:DEAD/DEAH box helicase [Candidatus Saccharibacteria bacterium]|nr:DEAD/DEAH box helicase [Candidatus Saccharibacteria bacterium]
MPYQSNRPRRGSSPARGGVRSVGSYGRSNSGRRSGGKKGSKQFIHPSKFINKATAYEAVAYEATHTFNDFGFSNPLMENINRKGYTIPSAIQDQSIAHVLEGRDVIGLANTGTGKTAAFLLPIIEKILKSNKQSKALIIAPTRELAQQINAEFLSFAKGLKIFSATLVGGANINYQIRDLQRRPNVIIGTPGRMKDMIERKLVKLDTIDTLVLDEADRMLDMGFLPDIRSIIESLPESKQTLFFSATITPEIEKLTRSFMQNPHTVSVRTGETSDHVEQGVVEFHDKMHKIEVLTQMLSEEEFEKVLVFGETKFGVQRLSDHLTKIGIPSEAIHGNKSQSQRERALRNFKNKKVKVLVATDVAARGLDIPNVSHVINFDTPQTYDDYVHRIGRTGRGGASGQAHTFIESKQLSHR